MDTKVLNLDDISVGQSARHEFTFSKDVVTRFGDLVDDHAPVHFDAVFAESQGFDGTIVHGYLLASLFSGLLGERLPGPNTVINALSLKYHQPVPVGAVLLKLTAAKSDGEIAVSGRTTCSFRTS